MADTTSVADEEELREAIASNEELQLKPGAPEELWKVWEERRENGNTDEVVIAVPGWYAENEFDKRRPLMFGEIEYDEQGKGAVLFSELQFIDQNILNNQVFHVVSMDDVTDVVDISDSNDYIDEAGKSWIPRTLMTIYSIDDSAQNDAPDGSITGLGSPNS